MMKRFYLPVLLISGFLVAKCKPDAPDMTGFDTPENSYQPVSGGSNWAYHETLSSGGSSDELIKMDGKRTTIKGKLYYAATDKKDSVVATTYFNHDKDSYFIRSSIIGGGLTVEYLYLKDNLAEGQTWTAPITDDGKLAGFPAQIVGKMVKSDTTFIMSNTTMKNVRHTQLQLQYDIGAGFQTYQLIDFYIARGVGIVRMDTDGGSYSDNKSTQVLTNYKIEK